MRPRNSPLHRCQNGTFQECQQTVCVYLLWCILNVVPYIHCKTVDVSIVQIVQICKKHLFHPTPKRHVIVCALLSFFIYIVYMNEEAISTIAHIGRLNVWALSMRFNSNNISIQMSIFTHIHSHRIYFCDKLHVTMEQVLQVICYLNCDSCEFIIKFTGTSHLIFTQHHFQSAPERIYIL